MATTAQSIVKNAGVVLNDTTTIRWQAPELVTWLNAGQLALIQYRPDASTTIVQGTLAAGTRQVLTSISEASALNPYRLMDVIRNVAVGSNQRAVRLVSRDLMDLNNPTWHGDAASINIENYMFDARDDTAFYVYPPATTQAKLEMLISVYPTPVAIPTGTAVTDVTGNIGVPDIYAPMLLDYVLYRAYLKDTEVPSSASRAAAHWTAFTTALGVEYQSASISAPAAADNVPTTPAK